jgi:hypothetical protein
MDIQRSVGRNNRRMNIHIRWLLLLANNGKRTEKLCKKKKKKFKFISVCLEIYIHE